jgi:acetyl-CoA C-acetyltransferase
MSIDPRTPVIVGVGQFLNRVDRGEPALEPTALMGEALRIAEADAGATGLVARAGVVACTPLISWRYRDPARLVADAFGNAAAATWYPAMGGNTPGMLLNRLAAAIARGDLEVGVLCGGEAWSTRTHVKRSGRTLDWVHQDAEVVPDWGSEDTFTMGHPAEHARGIVLPVQTYPLFETALMHTAIAEGTASGVEHHLRRVGEMWSDFSRVAEANPYAWRRQSFDASEITTPTAENRLVGWPYTKRMVSNPDNDMATGMIVCSAAAAEAAGIARDRWAFVHAGTDSKDRVMSQRWAFDASPSIGVAGRRALDLAGVGLDDVAHLDVYSCFPSAVELFCREFGIDILSRRLTVYGGLCFAGGPWNNPVGHALATMVEVLRSGDDGSLGFVTGNGGNVDKHSFTLLGNAPTDAPFRHERPQADIDALPGREVLTEHSGEVGIEAWTVMHARDNVPERFHAACLTPSGERVWGTSHDAGLMALATSSDLAGARAEIAADGTLALC